jgi:LPXTG-motif cell wall-anchored protein
MPKAGAYKRCASTCQPESGQRWTPLKRNKVITKTKTVKKSQRLDFCAATEFVEQKRGDIATNERGYIMNRFKFVAMVCCLVFVALAITPRVNADEFNKKTIMTFNEPIEVPGVGGQILPAGTYVFELVDVQGDRNVVQIFSADETHVYTTILAINNYRLKPTDKTVLTFKERGEGQPEAIKAWFYPGDNFGQQFVYPKKRAIELATIVKEPVLAAPIEVTEVVPVETLRSVPVVAIEPTGEEVPVTAVVQPPPAAVAAAPQATLVAETLPNTASSMPLFALIGVLSLFAGFTLMLISRRSV